MNLFYLNVFLFIWVVSCHIVHTIAIYEFTSIGVNMRPASVVDILMYTGDKKLFVAYGNHALPARGCGLSLSAGGGAGRAVGGGSAALQGHPGAQGADGSLTGNVSSLQGHPGAQGAHGSLTGNVSSLQGHPGAQGAHGSLTGNVERYIYILSAYIKKVANC